MDEVRTSMEKMLDSYDSPNPNRLSNSFNNSSANGDGEYYNSKRSKCGCFK